MIEPAFQVLNAARTQPGPLCELLLRQAQTKPVLAQQLGERRGFHTTSTGSYATSSAFGESRCALAVYVMCGVFEQACPRWTRRLHTS
jgi:hypothetical protein